MTAEALLARYGLVAVFVGAGLEGETLTVTGGLLAHQGYWPVWAAALAAALGSFAADQGFFYAGRRFQDHRWVKRARRRPGFKRAIEWFEAHPLGFIFGFRFLYGLRTISPIAIGTTRVKGRTFLIGNFVAAAVWGTLFTAIGYVFGSEFEELVGSLKPHLTAVLLAVAGVIALGLLVRGVRWWREERQGTDA